MAESPYTRSRHIQFRGPSTSDDYNARLEENYKDLTVLYNRARLAEEAIREGYDRLLKDHLGLMKVADDLEARVASLEGVGNVATFYTDSQVDNNLFNSTPYLISEVDRLTHDSLHGVLTLPKVETSSLSKLSFVNTDGDTGIPSTLEARVVGVTGTADSTAALIDTSRPEFAVVDSDNRIWQRNVIVNAANVNGAQCVLYIRVPTDLFTTDKSNALTITPYPALSTDILEVSTATKVDVVLDETDNYTAINSTAMNSGNAAAVGWSAPGGWNGDAIVHSGPKAFYFDPRLVTAVRIKLRQRSYATEGSRVVYSYGASSIDLRYDKFLTTGKAMIRFDAPAGDTISSVTGVTAEIWNAAANDDVIDTRILWETALNSGVFTLTPVALSSRVWVEVTLRETAGAGSPAISGLSISYT